MTFVRKVLNGIDITQGIEIPEEFKNMELEVLIFPLTGNKISHKKSKKSLAGKLSKYANKDLISKEENVWKEASQE